MSHSRLLLLVDHRPDLHSWRMMCDLAEDLAAEFDVHVGAMGAVVPSRLSACAAAVHRLGFPPPAPLAAVPWLRALQRRCSFDVVHAWGVVPTAVARMALSAAPPIVATIDEPLAGADEEKWLATARADRALPLLCPTATIRRVLVESGHPMTDCAVIRPAVDFGELNRARQTKLRARLGLAPEQPLLVTLPPPSRAGGQYYAIWAGALCRQIFPDLRMIVPGESREQARLMRFTPSFQQPDLAHFTGDDVSWAEVLAAADLCLAPALEPISTVPLAWAMAAGVPLIGSAIPAVTELLSHDLNALLCRAGEPDRLAARVLQLLRDRAKARQLANTARSQAFEVFSRRRMVEQHHLVYRNLLAGRAPLDGVADSAVHA